MLSSNFLAVIKVFALIFPATNVVCPSRTGNIPGRFLILAEEHCRTEITELFGCFEDVKKCFENAFLYLQHLKVALNDDLFIWSSTFFATYYRHVLRRSLRPGQVKFPREFCAVFIEEIRFSPVEETITSVTEQNEKFDGTTNFYYYMVTGQKTYQPNNIECRPIISELEKTTNQIQYEECISVLKKFFTGPHESRENGGRTRQSIVNQIYDKERVNLQKYKDLDPDYYRLNPEYPYIMVNYVWHVKDQSEYEDNVPSPIVFCTDYRILSEYIQHVLR